MIISFKWGEVVTKDKRGTTKVWKDCIITPNGPCEWDWRLDGTRHVPGVTVNALLNLKNCTHVILSTGIDQKLQITPEVHKLLQSWQTKGISYYITDSNSAVKKYADLIRDPVNRVGILLHSTC